MIISIGEPLVLWLDIPVFDHRWSAQNPNSTMAQQLRRKVFTTIASCIRKAFEKSYGRGWNVVVGRSFGAYVTHEIKTYMYFTVVPGVYVLLWRYVVIP